MAREATIATFGTGISNKLLVMGWTSRDFSSRKG